MPSWYLGKIKYQQEQENGALKSISEAYLVDAVSYTDAEARLYGIVADNTPDFQISSLTRMKLSDVFHFEEDDTASRAAKNGLSAKRFTFLSTTAKAPLT